MKASVILIQVLAECMYGDHKIDLNEDWTLSNGINDAVTPWHGKSGMDHLLLIPPPNETFLIYAARLGSLDIVSSLLGKVIITADLLPMY